MQKVLISWLGNADIINLPNPPEKDYNGPLFTILYYSEEAPFTDLWLFHTKDAPNPPANARKEALAIIENYCLTANINLQIVEARGNFPVSNPGRVHDFMLNELNRLCSKLQNYRLFYNLTSGTPAMYAIQLNLAAHSSFGGKGLYTVEKAYIEPGGKRVSLAHMPTNLRRATPDTEPELPDEYFMEPNQAIYDKIRLKVANTDAIILIQGETGTGKSHLVKYIHDQDKTRKTKEPLKINCAVLGADPNIIRSELFGHTNDAFTGARQAKTGAFVYAKNGTLFLDEIGELPLSIQPMLLTAVEDNLVTPLGAIEPVRVNPRLIVATNVDLWEAVHKGRFREDLYYRLAHYTARLKPVREYSTAHKLKLFQYALSKANADYTRADARELSPEAIKIFLDYHWPGNIRMVLSLIKSLCILSDGLITAADVLEQLPPSRPTGRTPISCLPSDLPSAEDLIPTDLPLWLRTWEEHWLRETNKFFPRTKDAAKRLNMKESTYSGKKNKLH